MLLLGGRGHPLSILIDLKNSSWEGGPCFDDLVVLGARWRAYLASRHSRAFPDGPSLSTPGRAVISMARRLTWEMAERILAIFGEGRSYNTTSYIYRPPVVPLAKLFD